jgi:competence protein ComEC
MVILPWVGCADRHKRLSSPRLLRASLLTSVFLTGLAAGAPLEHPEEFPRALGRSPLRLMGTLASLPRAMPSGISILLDLEQIAELPADGRVRLTVRGERGRDDLQQLLPGEMLRLAASVRPPRCFGNPGARGIGDSLRREGIVLIGSVKSPLLVESMGRRSRLLSRQVARLRRALLDGLRRATGPWDPQERYTAVVASMVLGERSGLEPSDRRTLGEAGTFHLLAVSGMHVGILAWVILVAARGAGLPTRGAYILVLLFLPVFALVTGLRPSVLRATWMAGALVAGRVLRRPRGAVNGLGLAALLALLAAPRSLQDAGLQLSFLAAVGILFFSAQLESRLVGPAWLRRPLAASLASVLAVAPILASMAHRVAPVGIIANLVAVPLAGVSVVSGGLASVIALTDVTVAQIPAWLSVRAVACLLSLSSAAAALPGASWASPGPRPWVAVCYYGLLAALAAPLPTRLKRVVLLLFLLAVLTVAVGGPGRPHSGTLRLDVLDVGQGDALLVRTPTGEAILIDGGGLNRSAYDVGERVVAPALWALGVRGLELVVGTHPHQDHLGGLPAVIRMLPTREVWLTPWTLESPSLSRLREACSLAGVPVHHARRGWTRRFGAVGIEVLHPGGNEGGNRPNRGSLVLRVRFGEQCLLLTGDADSWVETQLAHRGDLEPCSLLKVGHHGSRGATSRRLLQAIRPRIAAIPVGESNPWGHPDPATLERLRLAGARVLRTDRDGMISLETDGRWIRWSSWGGGDCPE